VLGVEKKPSYHHRSAGGCTALDIGNSATEVRQLPETMGDFRAHEMWKLSISLLGSAHFPNWRRGRIDAKATSIPLAGCKIL
jgi:hypothetical protein